MTKASDNGFKELYFITSKKSHLNCKTTYFENNPKTSVCHFKDNNSATLIGNVPFVEAKVFHEKLWLESHRNFFNQGVDDPKFRLLKFQTNEATFWIGNKFRTVKYKRRDWN